MSISEPNDGLVPAQVGETILRAEVFERLIKNGPVSRACGGIGLQKLAPYPSGTAAASHPSALAAPAISQVAHELLEKFAASGPAFSWSFSRIPCLPSLVKSPGPPTSILRTRESLIIPEKTSSGL